MATGNKHFGATADENFKDPACNFTSAGNSWSSTRGIANSAYMEDGWYRFNLFIINGTNQTQTLSVDFGSYTQNAYMVGESGKRIPYSFSFVVKVDKGYGFSVNIKYPNGTYVALFHTYSFQYLGAL